MIHATPVIDDLAWQPEPDVEPDCWGFNSYEHYKGACHHHERQNEWFLNATSLDAAKAVAEVMFCAAAQALYELGFNLKDDALDEVLARRIIDRWNTEDLAHAAVAVGYCSALEGAAA